jgi:hypothetical protein
MDAKLMVATGQMLVVMAKQLAAAASAEKPHHQEQCSHHRRESEAPPLCAKQQCDWLGVCSCTSLFCIHILLSRPVFRWLHIGVRNQVGTQEASNLKP